jgi:hypothetical protein
MIEQTQNPFMKHNENSNLLLVSILILGLITIGVTSIVNIQKRTNEDN